MRDRPTLLGALLRVAFSLMVIGLVAWGVHCLLSEVGVKSARVAGEEGA